MQQKKSYPVKVGSVVKSKDPGRRDYIKISQDLTLKAGECLWLSTVDEELARIDETIASGKSKNLSGLQKVRDNIAKTPEWVRFIVSHKPND